MTRIRLFFFFPLSVTMKMSGQKSYKTKSGWRERERESEKERRGILSHSGRLGFGFHAARRPVPAGSGFAHTRW